MNNFFQKLKLIFVPYLLTSISIIGGYTFLNWLFCIKLNVISVDEDIINFWIPFVLPYLVILLYLRPKFKLLNLKTKKGSWLAFFIMISGIAIAVPTIIAQSYIETATGKLTKLANINQINVQPTTKYYSLKNFYIDKRHIGVQSKFDVSGRYSEDFNMALYVVLPIFNSPNDTLNGKCIAWYGIEYNKQISNNLSKEEKEIEFKEFAKVSQMDFDSKNVKQFVYLERIGNTNDHKGYIEAINNDKVFLGSPTTVLLPIDEPFESRNGNKLPWILGAFGIGAIVLLIMVSIPKFDEQNLEKYNTGAVEKDGEIKEVIKFFLPKEGFYMTPLIIDLNILMFLIMVFSGLGFISFSPVDLIKWGGNYGPLTKDGEWWRLLTNIFLHGGLMHLLANMYGLLFVGIVLEPKIGKNRYLFIYLITGVLASLTSLWWHTATVSIGASGAVFGLYGAFLALLISKVFSANFNKAFLFSTVIFVGYNLLFGLTGNIDNAAHIGGLVSGFIIGILIAPKLKQEEEYQKFVEEAQQKISVKQNEEN